MFKVMKQVVDAAGIHRWVQFGTTVYANVDRAEEAMRRAARVSLSTPHGLGYRSTRFRIAPVLAAVVCLVLQ
jgi:hypothetical protein